MKTMTFHTDPGHGWLAVTMESLEAFGIADKISTYSYRNGDIAYLEEDCDAGLYINKMEGKGMDFKFNEVHKENTPIRNYPSYYY